MSVANPREFLTSDQWIQRIDRPGCQGYAYHDGVHRGFCLCCLVGLPTDSEWQDARAAAIAAARCRQQWSGCNR